ncbi:MAG: hypothetical protein JW395_0964 [Nitrospira sp.]|nr:hypothetical protein [Nitrospira sp.]
MFRLRQPFGQLETPALAIRDRLLVVTGNHAQEAARDFVPQRPVAAPNIDPGVLNALAFLHAHSFGQIGSRVFEGLLLGIQFGQLILRCFGVELPGVVGSFEGASLGVGDFAEGFEDFIGQRLIVLSRVALRLLRFPGIGCLALLLLGLPYLVSFVE